MARASSGTREQAAAVATIAAVQLLALAAGTEIVAAIGFGLGRALSPWVLAGGVAGALAAAGLGARRFGRSAAVVATPLAAIAFALALACAASTYDISWDGQNYQQGGVLALASGWNPFGPPLPVPQPYTTPFWVNHYAKGPWVRAAAVLLATGHVEAAKAWNVVLATAAALAWAGALLGIRRLRAAYAVLGAVLAALNPVFWSQIFTFYVDGQLASTLASLVALVAVTVQVPGPLPLLGLGASFLLLPGIKFTGAAYGVAFGALSVASLRLAARSRTRAAALAMACGLAAGIVVTGWNPYVTNLVREGHPLYPVAGSRKFDVMSGQAPRDFLERSRVAKLAIATFSASRNKTDATPVLKWPFTWKGDETTLFQHPDARYGGFGPLFSGVLVLSLFAFAFAAAARRSGAAALVAAAVTAALLATVLMNPEGWWARYAPQLWLVPIVLALSAAATPGRAALAAAGVTFATMIADDALVAVNAVHRVRSKSAEVGAQLQELAREPRPIVVQFEFGSNRRRLVEAGVPFVESDRLPCDAPEMIAYSRTRFCRGDRRDKPPPP